MTAPQWALGGLGPAMSSPPPISYPQVRRAARLLSCILHSIYFSCGSPLNLISPILLIALAALINLFLERSMDTALIASSRAQIRLFPSPRVQDGKWRSVPWMFAVLIELPKLPKGIYQRLICLKTASMDVVCNLIH